jgi:hypothetical protein
MTAHLDDNMDVITTLMLERERFAGWLRALDDIGDRTPERVRDRVRADYDERLRAVMEKLSARAEDVESTMASLATRTESLRAEERRHADARDEAELRAAVGEYASERWNDIRSQADAAIAGLRSEQQSLQTELSRLEQVLRVARPSQAPAAPEPAPSAAPRSRASVEASAPPPAPVESQHAAPMAAMAGGAAVDHLVAPSESIRPTEAIEAEPTAVADPPRTVGARSQAEVRMPSGPTTTRTTGTPQGDRGPSRWEPARQGSSGRGFDELAFLNSVMDGSDASSRPVQARRDLEQPVEKSGMGAVDLTPKEGFGSLASKSLRCQECGTLNYPTEWYCERCGGELSAI